MSDMSEREIQVANGDACPQCLTVYPGPRTTAATVTCGICGFCHHLRRHEDTLQTLGKPRYRDPGYHEAKQRDMQGRGTYQRQDGTPCTEAEAVQEELSALEVRQRMTEERIEIARWRLKQLAGFP